MSDVTQASSNRPTASLSRKIDSAPPQLEHALLQLSASVLSVITDEKYIYSGNQSADISVYDSTSFELKATLHGHTGSVLALEIARERNWLFSSSGDSTIRVWSTSSHSPLFILNPYLETDAGDLFSLAWAPSIQTLYFGCQNTSLQWHRFHDDDQDQRVPGDSTPKRAHKFFDSYPRIQRRPADLLANSRTPSPCPTGIVIDVAQEHVIDSAHYGYVYCMALSPSIREGADNTRLRVVDEVLLATGSGDETVKIWDCTLDGLSLVHEFECCHGAVLSLAIRGDNVYAGCQDGYVKVWDLQTKTLMRTIIVQEGVAVLSLSMLQSDLYTGSADGQVKRFSATFDCTASWRAHDGIVLSSIVSRKKSSLSHEYRLITGGNDGAINIWEIALNGLESSESGYTEMMQTKGKEDVFLYALTKFISIPSVSSLPECREDCRQAAVWLSKCLQQLGAPSKIISTGDENNPIVFASFQGSQTGKRKPRILVYGHYDVISAPPEGWDSDPFHLTARNGFLYGRGVSDDKGPILAIACAAAGLLRQRKLGLDLLFLIEGEEETGSVGFREAVQRYKDHVGPIDAILVSNSSWIAPNVPSITYGLRGVVHCNIQITSGRPDLHSGVYGGGVQEPMLDMIQLLASLQDHDRKVRIPGFYDSVRKQDQREADLFKLLEEITQSSTSLLRSRWCEPSLTIHNIQGSGPSNSTVISSSVSAQVSVRIVPDQDLDSIARKLCEFVEHTFAELKSCHSLTVSIDHTADWWLGELEHPWFKALETAIQDEWGVPPMRVREGGTIPCVPFLEKEFNCPALHLPMGQSADQAHLPNEHLALSHLCHGQSVVERFLLAVSESAARDEA